MGHSQSRFVPAVLHSQREAKNRVLPLATNPSQRLRSTDNGYILQNGGTISGRKKIPVYSLEPFSQNSICAHRKSHSDPDIVRMMMIENDVIGENKRSIKAVSSSQAKIKSRKKKRAPEPPLSNTLPRTLDRVPISNSCSSHDFADTYRRPLPPIPPPPPDYNKTNDEELKSMSKNYEKNRRTAEKWKFNKMHNESRENQKRCKLIDAEIRENKSGQRNNSSYLASECAFKDKRGQEHRNHSFKLSMQNTSPLHDQRSYFQFSYDKKYTIDVKNILTKQMNSIPRFFPEVSSSSEEEMEIDLQLRPTLPRRPIEVSRFSPTDVWKSINLDFFKSHQQRSDISSDDEDGILEEKIYRINRPVAPRRLIHDGDSGISPDAGSPRLLNKSLVPVEQYSSMWVPQHDLADDSECESYDALLDNSSKANIQVKFSMPNLMFPSRSLPRTDQIKYEVVLLEKERKQKKNHKSSEGQHFNSLRNLKKALRLRAKVPETDNKGIDSNWSLSRSLPNFINSFAVNNNIYIEKEDILRRNHKAAHCDFNSESFPGHSSEGHVIYLPEYKSSKSTNQVVEDLHVNMDNEIVLRKFNNRKKFSYQSTVRQEEKKKLEEKLAREVEARERKRQKEIEWMNKVEEEFRKQRDKEKVNIRHQLRIFNLKESSPPCEEAPTGMKKWLKRHNRDCSIRPEPEGSSDEQKNAQM